MTNPEVVFCSGCDEARRGLREWDLTKLPGQIV